ncbi:helix-turn-helix domain-containing protein [Dyadobacter crusticola]|uniref:helix-turn-helix domain-containing protein n=1 Tax=Dyadobacter crusticola TaxID=292407 RepID=UPI0004E20881|nr:transcriptional regulator [Dyadobacter crusticola]
MELRPIETKEQHEQMLEWVDRQFDIAPDPNSPEGIKLQIALILIKAFEDVHYPISAPDPIEVVKQKMDEKGLKSKDLVIWIGSKSYVSALLNRKKPLTLKIARILHEKLGIPAKVFLG